MANGLLEEQDEQSFYNRNRPLKKSKLMCISIADDDVKN